MSTSMVARNTPWADEASEPPIRKGTWTASNAAATRLRAPESGSIGRDGIAVGLLEQLFAQRQAGGTQKDFMLARKRVQPPHGFSGAADQRREVEGSAQLLGGRQAALNFEEDLPGLRAVSAGHIISDRFSGCASRGAQTRSLKSLFFLPLLEHGLQVVVLTFEF